MSFSTIMELKSLILGLVFSVGIFAVKSGAGLAYILKKEARIGRKIWAIAGFIACYGLLFAFSWLLIQKLNFLAHLDTVMELFKNGMALHFLLAALLMVWGIYLLKKDGSDQRSHGWLLLSLPCPVCFSVILFSGSFLHSLRPDEPFLFGLLGVGFVVVGLSTASLFAMLKKSNPEHDLGMVMMLAGLYFVLSLVVVPQFADFEQIYRLSVGIKENPPTTLPYLFMALSLLFTTGLVKSLGSGSWK